jgi:hypothetical protein
MERGDLALCTAAAVAQYRSLGLQGDGDVAREVALDFIRAALAAGVAERHLQDLCVRVLGEGGDTPARACLGARRSEAKRGER